MKTLSKIFKQDKEKFVVPKGVQDAIPIKTIWEDGIFLVGKNKYSKCYKFTDINYAVASKDDKEAMFLEYSELLNSFDTGATTKITIANRKLNKIDFEKNIMLSMENDNLDEYRKEYNKMLLSKVSGSNGIIQEKFITISVDKKSIEDARNYFLRVGIELSNHFKELGSTCTELDAVERLRIFHDLYRVGEETYFYFDMLDNMRKGHSFKDFMCPDTMEFHSDYFKIGDRFGRVIFLKEYANYIKDSMVAELTDINRNMMMSIDVIPIPMDEAVKEAENRRLGIETNISSWQRKQNANNNFSAIIPYDLEIQREQSKEFLDDLVIRDQRMYLSVLTMVHTAETKEQLDNDTETIFTIARKNLCQFSTLKFQQLDGLNTAIPFGVRKIDSLRTLTTESLAVFMPFRVQEIRHNNGIYYGQNVISKNMIIADRKQLLNGNSFILGVSGSGKSFTAKEEIITTMLRDKNSDIVLIDPENEYLENYAIIDYGRYDYDTIVFGKYYNYNDKKINLEWIVLDKNEDMALLLTKDVINCKCFDDTKIKTTYNNSSIRKWLNEEFYNEVFSDSEKMNIIEIKNINIDLQGNRGEDSIDKAFLLSLDEVEKYFGKLDNIDENNSYEYIVHNNRAQAFPTQYAKEIDNMGEKLFYSKAEDKDYGGACEWWLRTMNSDKKSTAIVYCNGYAEGLEKNHLINYKNRGVRPAIWVKYK